MPTVRKIDLRQFHEMWYRPSPIGFDTWMVAVLITSYFFCLPLGRYSVGVFATDFRLFDFCILLFLLTSGYRLSGRIRRIRLRSGLFVRYVSIMAFLIILSLLFTTIYEGTRILPSLIRTYRFLSYLFTSAFVIAVVNNAGRFRFMANVLFFNICIQASIAFMQAMGWLPNFWPQYWREMYSFNDAPVATLSPHHKHIGVVMLMGLSIGIAYFRSSSSFFGRAFILLAVSLMISIPLFSGTRTWLLGLAFLLLAYIYKSPWGLVAGIMIMTGFIALMLNVFNIEEEVIEKLSVKYEQRINSRIEKFGYYGLYRDRAFVYRQIPMLFEDKPYVLVTGTGFQNISNFIGANGAHNNFLHVLIELGIVGLVVFLIMLYQINKNLLAAGSFVRTRFETNFIQHAWMAFIGIVGTMFVGETLWGQAAMFTLSGQIMAVMGLAVSPYFWFYQGLSVNA